MLQGSAAAWWGQLWLATAAAGRPDSNSSGTDEPAREARHRLIGMVPSTRLLSLIAAAAWAAGAQWPSRARLGPAENRRVFTLPPGMEDVPVFASEAGEIYVTGTPAVALPVTPGAVQADYRPCRRPLGPPGAIANCRWGFFGKWGRDGRRARRRPIGGDGRRGGHGACLGHSAGTGSVPRRPRSTRTEPSTCRKRQPGGGPLRRPRTRRPGGCVPGEHPGACDPDRRLDAPQRGDRRRAVAVRSRSVRPVWCGFLPSLALIRQRSRKGLTRPSPARSL